MISRSRSKERYFNNNNEIINLENSETDKEEYIERMRETEIENKISKMKENNFNREKEWDIEKQYFLKRERVLMREIGRLKFRENQYNQERRQRNYIPKYQYQQSNFQRYIPRQNRFSNFPRNKPLINNINYYYKPFNTENTIKKIEKEKESPINDIKRNDNFNSELDNLISNLEKKDNNEIKKFRNKIKLPKIEGVNFVGLIIGPKGIFQKLLEKESGCKIYINGKIVSKTERYKTPYEKDDPHVLIVADSEEKLKIGTHLIEEIIYADEKTRNKIIYEQLKASKEQDAELINFRSKNDELKSDDYLMTPYGPPSKNARYYKVPNDCISSIIGPNEDILKRISIDSNCKIQIGKAPIPNTNLRYVFIEGTEENYQIAKGLIDRTIGDALYMKVNSVNSNNQ